MRIDAPTKLLTLDFHPDHFKLEYVNDYKLELKLSGGLEITTQGLRVAVITTDLNITP